MVFAVANFLQLFDGDVGENVTRRLPRIWQSMVLRYRDSG
jgi:hypothetical protein